MRQIKACRKSGFRDGGMRRPGRSAATAAAAAFRSRSKTARPVLFCRPEERPLPERLHPLLKPLLAEDWAAVDPALPPLLEMLFARSAGEDWHKAGTFRDHLLGVHRTLALWDQPREVRLLGLFHSVYSNEYVDLKLFDASGNRAELADALGAEAERLIHIFCTMP